VFDVHAGNTEVEQTLKAPPTTASIYCCTKALHGGGETLKASDT